METFVHIGDVTSFKFEKPNRTSKNVGLLAEMLRELPNSLFSVTRIKGRYLEYRFFTAQRQEFVFHRLKRVLTRLLMPFESQRFVILGLFVNRHNKPVFGCTTPLSDAVLRSFPLQSLFLQPKSPPPQRADVAEDSLSGDESSDDAEVNSQSDEECESSSDDDVDSDDDDDDPDFVPDDAETTYPSLSDATQDERAVLTLRDGERFATSLQKCKVTRDSALFPLLTQQHGYAYRGTVKVDCRKRERDSTIRAVFSDDRLCTTTGLAATVWSEYRRSILAEFDVQAVHRLVDCKASADKAIWLNGLWLARPGLLLSAVLQRILQSAPDLVQPARLHLQIGLDGKPETGLTASGGKVFSIWIRFANVNCHLLPQSLRRAVPIAVLAGGDYSTKIRLFLSHIGASDMISEIQRDGLRLDNGRHFPVFFTVVGDLPAVRSLFDLSSQSSPFGGPSWFGGGTCLWSLRTLDQMHSPRMDVRLADRHRPVCALLIASMFILYGFLHSVYHVITCAITDAGNYALKRGGTGPAHPFVKAVDVAFPGIKWNPCRLRVASDAPGKKRKTKDDKTNKPPRTATMKLVHRFAENGGLLRLSDLADGLPAWNASSDKGTRVVVSVKSFMRDVHSFCRAYREGCVSAIGLGRSILHAWIAMNALWEPVRADVLSYIAGKTWAVRPHFDARYVGFGPSVYTCLEQACVAINLYTQLRESGDIVCAVTPVARPTAKARKPAGLPVPVVLNLEKLLGEFWLEACMKLVRRVCARFALGLHFKPLQLPSLFSRLIEHCLVQPLTGSECKLFQPSNYDAPS